MDVSNFSIVLNWIISQSYLLVFLAMCVEGPVVTAAAAFASAQGYFNPALIFVLSIMGDMVPDSIYYYLGYFSRKSIIDRYGKYFGLHESRMLRIEKLLEKNLSKTIVALKFTPLLPIPGFMLVGSTKGSFFKFFTVCLSTTLVKTTIFLVTGYYFGKLYNFGKYIKYGEYLLLFLVVIFIILYFVYKKFLIWLGNKIEKI